MLKRRPPLRLLGVLTFGVIFLLASGAGSQERSEYGNPFTRVTVGAVQVKAEVVESPEKMYLGLGSRRELPEGRGMLFVMPSLEVQHFCMRGMQFPLDFIWIVRGRVAGLDRDIAADYAGEIVSPEPVNYVLEVPAGLVRQYGIKVGDRVRWQ